MFYVMKIYIFQTFISLKKFQQLENFFIEKINIKKNNSFYHFFTKKVVAV